MASAAGVRGAGGEYELYDTNSAGTLRKEFSVFIS
jgi:hypothetical protein